MGGVALFDLDRTLIDCNSGRLWVASEWREGRLRLADVVWAGWWLGRYSLGLDGGLEAAMEAAVASVVGTPEEELEARVAGWFEREVRHRLRPGAAEALAAHRAAGDALVLATSGTWYAARAAAAAYGLDDVVATRLAVEEGRFTGKVEVLAIGAGKARAVEDWAAARGVDLREATFYTDSATDLALLERVARPVAVNPDRALARVAAAHGWPVLDWGRAVVS